MFHFCACELTLNPICLQLLILPQEYEAVENSPTKQHWTLRSEHGCPTTRLSLLSEGQPNRSRRAFTSDSGIDRTGSAPPYR